VSLLTLRFLVFAIRSIEGYIRVETREMRKMIGKNKKRSDSHLRDNK
jgi:hypothetical protein